MGYNESESRQLTLESLQHCYQFVPSLSYRRSYGSLGDFEELGLLEPKIGLKQSEYMKTQQKERLNTSS
jgi:hypothetical protein